MVDQVFTCQPVEVIVAVAGGGSGVVNDLGTVASCCQGVIVAADKLVETVSCLHIGEAVEGVVAVGGGFYACPHSAFYFNAVAHTVVAVGGSTS